MRASVCMILGLTVLAGGIGLTSSRCQAADVQVYNYGVSWANPATGQGGFVGWFPVAFDNLGGSQWGNLPAAWNDVQRQGFVPQVTQKQFVQQYNNVAPLPRPMAPQGSAPNGGPGPMTGGPGPIPSGNNGGLLTRNDIMNRYIGQGNNANPGGDPVSVSYDPRNDPSGRGSGSSGSFVGVQPPRVSSPVEQLMKDRNEAYNRFINAQNQPNIDPVTVQRLYEQYNQLNAELVRRQQAAPAPSGW